MLRFLLTLAAILLVPHPALAEEEEPADAILSERAEQLVVVMQGDLAYEDLFAQNFRNAIPEEQFVGITGQMESQFGAVLGLESVEPVSPNSAALRLRFERAVASGTFQIQNAEPYLVTGFVISAFEPLNDRVEALIADMQALPGSTSLLVTRLDGDEPVIAHNAEVQMALGSTFKLYVLSALARSIGTGGHSWDEVVPLSVRSFPSGQMQDWPEGTPVTLQTLATMMISISDNTATDQLIAILGRDAVEAEVMASGHTNPDATFPFMTTRELFLLKSGSADLLEAYRTSDLAGRRAMLANLAEETRDNRTVMAAFSGSPRAIDIEWFASAHDIARLFRHLRDVGDETALAILGINPSLSAAGAEDWAYVGYKGGSEPGVLNMSWLLRNPAGEWTAVSIGWNNPDAAVDLQQLELLAIRAIALAGAN